MIPICGGCGIEDRVITSVEDRRRAVLDLIRGARREVRLSLFRCKDQEVVKELRHAVRRGVDVQAIVTARAKGGHRTLRRLRETLGATGVSVKVYGDPVVKYHAKYLVVDDGPAAILSCNFTRKCFESTCDALVVTYDPDVVRGLKQLIAADRDGWPLSSMLTPRLLVAPERARARYTDLIEGARSSIRLIDAKLSDPDIVALLAERRAAGVAVEVCRAKRLGALKSHAKALLIDDRVAVVGSLALAALSLDFRREVAIVVQDPAAVADVAKLFRSAHA